jgi:hypothetical protein
VFSSPLCLCLSLDTWTIKCESVTPDAAQKNELPREPSDGTTRIVYFDHVLELMTGIPASEALGKAPYSLFGYFRNEEVRKSMLALNEKSRKLRAEGYATWLHFILIFILQKH